MVGTQTTDEKPYEWNVRLKGAPRGRPVDVRYYFRRERKTTGVISQTIEYTTWDDAYIGVQLARPVPELEIVSHKSSLGPIARRHPWPLQRFNDPMVDAELAIASPDPNAGAKIAQLLLRFDPALRGYGVHLIQSEGWPGSAPTRPT